MSNKINWENIRSIDEFIQLVKVSTETKQSIVLFKHSNQCSISLGASTRLEGWDIPDNILFAKIDVIGDRDVSNAIALQWEVQHESPQVLVLKNNKIIGSFSHFEVTVSNILSLL